jgi:hypothetical protein
MKKRLFLILAALGSTGVWYFSAQAAVPRSSAVCDCQVCDGPQQRFCYGEQTPLHLQCIEASSFLPCMTDECDPGAPCQ